MVPTRLSRGESHYLYDLLSVSSRLYYLHNDWCNDKYNRSTTKRHCFKLSETDERKFKTRLYFGKGKRNESSTGGTNVVTEFAEILQQYSSRIIIVRKNNLSAQTSWGN